MTIYDIAKALGVSSSTVSRVINNKSNVRNETRKRVLDYLDKHSYSPNEMARGLVNQASKMIGILIADVRNAHHAEGVYYIRRELEKFGYCCIIMDTGTEDESKAKYVEILSSRRVEGAILIGSTFQSDVVKKAIVEYLPLTPIIIANGKLDLPNVYGVIADEQNGVSNCVKLLVKKGRKNIAFVIDNYTPSNMLKQMGFLAGMSQWYGTRNPLVIKSDEGMQGAYKATEKLVSEYPILDGIIYAVDMLAIGGLRALNDMKIDVPNQISIIGVDNSIYGEICTPTLTSLDNKLFDLSITSARVLIDLLQNKPTPKDVMLISSIVERQST